MQPPPPNTRSSGSHWRHGGTRPVRARRPAGRDRHRRKGLRRPSAPPRSRRSSNAPRPSTRPRSTRPPASSRLPPPRFDAATFQVPTPAELLAHRKADRTGSTGPGVTANYLYVQGHFELCLAYVVSFAVSMDIPFAFGSAEGEYARWIRHRWRCVDRSRSASSAGTGASSRMSSTSACVRSLRCVAPPPAQHVSVWVPCDSDAGYGWRQVELDTLRRVSGVFHARGARWGGRHARAGFSNMVVRTPDGKRGVDMDKVQQQNWTVTHGLALTAGDLALEFGLWRTAIEAHTLFSRVAVRCGACSWRLRTNSPLTPTRSLPLPPRAVEALHVVAKAAVVAALQAVPRRRKVELAQLVVADHRVIPQAWIDAALQPDFTQPTPFDDEDALLFDGLSARRARGRWCRKKWAWHLSRWSLRKRAPAGHVRQVPRVHARVSPTPALARFRMGRRRCSRRRRLQAYEASARSESYTLELQFIGSGVESHPARILPP